MQYYKVDNEGYYIEPVIADYPADIPIPENIVAIPPPEPSYRPKWDGETWTETSPMPDYDNEKQIAIWDGDQKKWGIESKPRPTPDYSAFIAGLMEGYTNG